MNEENLIPMSERSKEEVREIARRGGIKSGETRRRKKTFKQELTWLLEEGDTQKNITLALIKEALEGNTKAFEVIRDTVGEKPIDKLEADIGSEINIVIK
jgi:hypothetical protein